MLQFFLDSKSLRASKSNHWFKNYSNFNEWVDLPIGGASAVNGAILYSLRRKNNTAQAAGADPSGCNSTNSPLFNKIAVTLEPVV